MEKSFAEVLFLLNSACQLPQHLRACTYGRLLRCSLAIPLPAVSSAVKPKAWDHYILEMPDCTARFVGITPADWRGALHSGFLDRICETGGPVHGHWSLLRSKQVKVTQPPEPQEQESSVHRARPKRKQRDGGPGIFSGLYTDEDGVVKGKELK